MNKFKNAYSLLCEMPKYRCPCCRYATLEEGGRYEICHVCFWEDDGQDDDADDVRRGPNGLLSLTDARANFEIYGASEPRRIDFVRPPLQAKWSVGERHQSPRSGSTRGQRPRRSPVVRPGSGPSEVRLRVLSRP